jgi:hypothetical protein
MAKKKNKDDVVMADSGVLLASMAKAAESAYQAKGIYTRPDADGQIVGLPLDHLSQRFLYQSTHYPLGRVSLLVGRTESGKSAYLSEVVRWHADCGGGGMIRGTEGRDIKDLRDSILGYRENVCKYEACETVEHWQSGLTFAVSAFRKAYEQNPNQAPICFGVDSLRGARSKKVDEQIEKDGYADPKFSPEAKMFYAYFGYISQRLEGLPISLVVTNHLLDAIKDSRCGHGPAYTLPGGEGQRFYSTFVVEMTKVNDLKPSEKDGVRKMGRRIRLKTLKNSLASEVRLKIEVELIWWFDCGIQHTAWNWDKATTELLLAMQSEDNEDTESRRAARDLIGLVSCKRGNKGNHVWSDALGVPQSDPVDYRTAGTIIEGRRDILADLEPILHIRRRSSYPPIEAYLASRTAEQTRAWGLPPGGDDLVADTETEPVAGGGFGVEKEGDDAAA